MFDLIKNALGKKRKEVPDKQADVKRTQLAACVILLETAMVDDEFTNAEREHIITTLKTVYNLSRDYAEELMELAQKERDQAVDLWRFTNQINQNFSRPEKLSTMEAVWQLIYADGRLDKHEDYIAHKLGNLLRLTHKELITAKLKAKENMQDEK